MIKEKNNLQVLIIFHRLNLIMKSVSKIINSNLNINSLLVHFNEINSDPASCLPSLLVIDQTIIDNGSPEFLAELNLKYSGVKILIITLDVNWKLTGVLSERNDIEVLNLWKSNPSLSKSLMCVVRNMLNSTMEIG